MSVKKFNEELEDYFRNAKPKTIKDHAELLAPIYDKWAKSITTKEGNFLVKGNIDGFKKGIMLLDAPGNTGPLVGIAYEQACIFYWTQPAFSTNKPAAGLVKTALIVSTPHLPGPVSAALAAAVFNPSPDPKVKAGLYASGFISGASTVMTTASGPSIATGNPLSVGPDPVVIS